MPIRLSRFEMPTTLVRDNATATETYARFTADPFEIGYGRTIGNSLRRVLLSSIEGFAIKAIKLQGAAHEFCSIPGIKEDVTDIVLNLKKVLFKSFDRETRWLHLEKKGPWVVTAADFAEDNSIEILNPDQPIATLDVDGEINLDVQVGVGRGFCLAEGNKDPSFDIGVIPIDAAFSPVTRVNYDVVNTRVGQRTDYEKLILDIWTDGRVSPDEALKTSAALLRHHLDAFVQAEEIIIVDPPTHEGTAESEELRRKLNMGVGEIELSVRSANCLNSAEIKTVGELVQKTEADMLKYRNFGKKSLTEIKEKLQEMGLSLGFKFDPNLLNHNA